MDSRQVKEEKNACLRDEKGIQASKRGKKCLPEKRKVDIKQAREVIITCLRNKNWTQASAGDRDACLENPNEN